MYTFMYCVQKAGQRHNINVGEIFFHFKLSLISESCILYFG